MTSAFTEKRSTPRGRTRENETPGTPGRRSKAPPMKEHKIAHDRGEARPGKKEEKALGTKPKGKQVPAKKTRGEDMGRRIEPRRERDTGGNSCTEGRPATESRTSIPEANQHSSIKKTQHSGT